MHKLSFICYFIAILFISMKAYSLSSSSYLVANSAVLLFDYEVANMHYEVDNLNNFNSSDLEKKLLAFVNTDSIDKASIVAKEILKKNKTNQEAWLVYLIEATLNNYDKPFVELKEQNQEEELYIINLIFNNDLKFKSNNTEIAKSIYNIVTANSDQLSSYQNIYHVQKLQNYNYLLFYLSLSLILNQALDEAYFYSAKIYQRLNNYKKAAELYNKINNNHSLYLEGQINVAKNKRHVVSVKEAEQDLIFLIKNNLENQYLFLVLADFYRSTKQYKKAIPYYSKILNKYNLDEDQKWRLLYLRGICYERLNNWVSAEEDFINSLEINSESPQVLNYLAYGWIERNKFLDRSLKMLQLAYEKNPDSHYILDSLAWAHFKKNNLIIASELMEQVIAKAPGEAISIDHLGDIYFAIGRKREAFYMWKQAKDLANPEDDIIDKLQKKLKKYHAG